MTFFNVHNPFPETPNIMSITSGVVGDDSVNCHRALEIGIDSLKSIFGKNFEDVSFPRKNKVVTLESIQSLMKVDDNVIQIKPLLLFQHICANISSKEDMKKYLKYELSPIPLSHFGVEGFKKNTKSQLYEEFTSTDETITGSILHVIDGGFLLHKVVWPKDCTVEEIIEKYLAFVRNNYPNNSWIIFDGYPDDACGNTQSTSTATKKAERLR